MAKKNEILYSDQVNDIISRPPKGIIRWGTFALFAVFMLLLILSWIVKYPEIITAPVIIVRMENEAGYENSAAVYQAKVKMGIERSGKVVQGRKVNIKVSAWPYIEYGMIRGYVSLKTLSDSGSVIIVTVKLPDGITTLYGKQLEYSENMQGTADILADDMRLLQKIINPLRHLASKNSR